MDSFNKDFYQDLRKKVSRWANSNEARDSKWTEYILLIPDLFHLLCKLILDPEVPVVAKAKLGIAIAYFISPIDFIPEAFLGPLGYADDLVVTALTLNVLINETESNIVQKHWAGDEDILVLIKRIIDSGDQMINKGIFNKLKAIINTMRK